MTGYRIEGEAASSFRIISAPEGSTTELPVTLGPGVSASMWVEVEAARAELNEAELVLLTTGALPEVRVPLSAAGRTLPACQYTLAPSPLRIGPTELTRTRRRPVLLTNTGTDDCLLTGVRWLDDARGQVRLESPPAAGTVIPPGESLPLWVRHSPAVSGATTARLELSVSASASQAYPTVPLALEAIASSPIVASPLEVRWGALDGACPTARRSVGIHNLGDDDWTLEAPMLEPGSDPVFSLPGAAAQSLAPRRAIDLDVRLDTSRVGTFVGAILVRGRRSSEPAEVLARIPLLARVGSAAPHVEVHRQGGSADEVDILFVLDGSGSALNDREALADEVGILLARAAANTVDYRVGVISNITRDSAELCSASVGTLQESSPWGPAANKIVRPQSLPTPTAVLQSNLSLPIRGGNTFEDTLYAVVAAVSPSSLAGSNAGLVRPGAALSVVALSDEPALGFPQDMTLSPGSTLAGLRSAKGPGTANRVSFSAIVAPYPPGTCSGPSGYAASSGIYAELVRASGGSEQSICTTDWTQLVTDFTSTLLGVRDTFFLEYLASSTQLEVYVANSAVPAREASGTLNWSYDLERNAVVFAPASLPEPGDEVRIAYPVRCN